MLSRKVLLVILSLIAFSSPAAWSADTGPMSVQVKQCQVRSAPSFMARIIATLPYGERISAVSSQGTWVQVFIPAGGVNGWVHGSALTRKKIVLKAGAANVDQTATSDELALAGKGFNRTVEGEYRTKHKDLDYSRIDQMEKLNVSHEAIREFLKKGAVSPQGGVQ